MKFCAVICEYNPFHSGHRYQFEQIRRAGYEHILCLMSGNFTQRGEAAIFHKYTRARHAILSGADVVLELPAAFACSPAELFAGGAVHILSALPNVEALAFGCESGSREDFLEIAAALQTEDKPFKAALKEKMKDGTSYIRARNAALLETHPDIDGKLLSAPNNILGTEYCRALLSCGSTIIPLPIPRVGSGYADSTLYREFSSATAIRSAMKREDKSTRKLLKSNLPAHVLQDALSFQEIPYAEAAVCALLRAEKEEIAKVPDCSEGLENRLLSMAKSSPRYEELIGKVVTKRYTAARLRRILLQNFLGIRLKEVREFLTAPLYAKVLAVKADGAEEILSSLAGELALLARKSDALPLKKEALDCFRLDVRANDLYNALSGTNMSEYLTLFV